MWKNNMIDIKTQKEQSLYARKDIPIENNSSMVRWLNKEIKESISLMDYPYWCSTNYEVSNNQISIKASTKAFNQSPRPTVSFKLNLNGSDISKYNRLRIITNINATGHRNFYIHVGFSTYSKNYSHAPIVEANKDEEIIFEIERFERTQVNEVFFTCFMMGTPDEALDEITINIKDIRIDIVDVDYDLGWVANEISYSHIGYLPTSNKIAIISNTLEKEFTIYNKGEEVYRGRIENITSTIGTFYICDFTKLTKEGIYTLIIGDKTTNEFQISNDIFESPILKSLNFLRLLRCGVQVNKVHSACHVNCRCYHDNYSVPVSGGWHDAGDVSQFEICTAEILESLVDLYNCYLNDYQMKERIKEEIKVGVDWLLKTRFGDGYRALAVLYNVWRKSKLSIDDDSVGKNVAENGPFENFLASLALIKASKVLREDDEIYSDYIKRVAIEDFEFGLDGLNKGLYTKRWGPCILSQTSGVIVDCACEIYKATNDEKYLDIAHANAINIIDCQEKNEIGSVKLKGFFYEDKEHKYMLTYEHRGHEQNPIKGLVNLCLTDPLNDDYNLWYNAIEDYKNYILKTKDVAYPYSLLPNHIYNINKINIDRFTVPSSYGTIEWANDNLIKQVKKGIKLDDEFFLRIFPVSIQRRGFHATLLSKVKAASSILKLDKDKALYQTILNQIEWIFGKNPFSSSTMYGEGYNYHPLYVAFSNQLVGALPVGIETYELEDAPYWPQATQAVYKEIWGHTTSKLLYVLSDILEFKNENNKK